MTSNITKVYISGQNKGIFDLFYNKGYTLVAAPSFADIVVFIPGYDVDPELYGERRTHPKISVDRGADRRDKDAWLATSKNKLKVGIGRGAQFLNVMNGGKLYQHVAGHVRDHLVYDTLNHDTFVVSGNHHQVMIPNEGAEILAYAEDVGTVFYGSTVDPVMKPKYEAEILWYENTNSLCYQPHPYLGDDTQKSRFFDLIGLFI